MDADILAFDQVMGLSNRIQALLIVFIKWKLQQSVVLMALPLEDQSEQSGLKGMQHVAIAMQERYTVSHPVPQVYVKLQSA